MKISELMDCDVSPTPPNQHTLPTTESKKRELRDAITKESESAEQNAQPECLRPLDMKRRQWLPGQFEEMHERRERNDSWPNIARHFGRSSMACRVYYTRGKEKKKKEKRAKRDFAAAPAATYRPRSFHTKSIPLALTSASQTEVEYSCSLISTQPQSFDSARDPTTLQPNHQLVSWHTSSSQPDFESKIRKKSDLWDAKTTEDAEPAEQNAQPQNRYTLPTTEFPEPHTPPKSEPPGPLEKNETRETDLVTELLKKGEEWDQIARKLGWEYGTCVYCRRKEGEQKKMVTEQSATSRPIHYHDLDHCSATHSVYYDTYACSPTSESFAPPSQPYTQNICSQKSQSLVNPALLRSLHVENRRNFSSFPTPQRQLSWNNKHHTITTITSTTVLNSLKETRPPTPK